MTSGLPTHFHFGLGNLGLGLVVPLFAGKTELYGLVRAASPDQRYDVLQQHKRYRRDVIAPSGEQKSEWIDIGGVLRYGADGLLDAAAQVGPPHVVTCSIKNDIPSLFPLLAALIDAHRERYRASPLLFLPFENARNVGGAALEYITRHVTGGADCVIAADSIVDKICSNTRVESGVCVVKTQPREQLLFSDVGRHDDNRLEVELARLQLDRYLYGRQRFEFEVRKKTWLVNGLHYCIAMCAYHLNLPVKTVQEALQHPPVAATAAQFALEMLLALHARAEQQTINIDVTELLEYAETVWAGMHMPPPDDTVRILPAVSFMLIEMTQGKRGPQAFVGFGDFFRKWNERVSEPAAFVLEHHASIEGALVSPALNGMLVEVLGEYLAAISDSQ